MEEYRTFRCEYCGGEHKGEYGKGRFCNATCARSFSNKVSQKDEYKRSVCLDCGEELFIKLKASPTSARCLPCKKKRDAQRAKDARRRKAEACGRVYVERINPLQSREVIGKKCLFCKKSFTTKEVTRAYCSQECVRSYKKEQYICDWLKTGIPGKHTNPSAPTNTTLRRYILESQAYKCAVCGLPQEWNGKPITFVLDHISGLSTDNSRENLRLVCPNCDSQLDTYKSKNRGKGRGTLEKMKNKTLEA